MGKNTISYIHEVRIKKAVNLLNEGKHSIKEIAELTGYENLNNFYKYFKIFKGNTPAMYIQGQIEDK